MEEIASAINIYIIYIIMQNKKYTKLIFLLRIFSYLAKIENK